MAANVLVSVDFSDTTESVLVQAKKLSQAMDAKIWLIHVPVAKPDLLGYEAGAVFVRDHIAQRLQSEHHMLQDFKDRLKGDGFDVETMLLPGNPAEKILEKAHSIQPDLIVLGSHGHGAMCHLLAGSVCDDVIKGADCPVVIVPVTKHSHLHSTAGIV